MSPTTLCPLCRPLYALRFHRKPQQLPIAADTTTLQLPIAADSLGQPTSAAAPTGTNLDLSAAIGSEIDFPANRPGSSHPNPVAPGSLAFAHWEKSRQVGPTK